MAINLSFQLTRGWTELSSPVYASDVKRGDKLSVPMIYFLSCADGPNPKCFGNIIRLPGIMDLKHKCDTVILSGDSLVPVSLK